MEDFVFNLYQRLGDYFTGSTKRNGLYAFFLIIFIILIPVTYWFEITVEAETLYWVFSSLTQALLALVALMGVVSIFKLQNLNESKRMLAQEIFDAKWLALVYGKYTPIELLLRAIDKFIKDNATSDSHHIVALKKLLEDNLLSKSLVIDYARKFSIYTFAIVMLSLVFLMFTQQISSSYVGTNILFAMFILTGYALFLAAKGLSYTIDA